jgi:hypothetical protein
MRGFLEAKHPLRNRVGRFSVISYIFSLFTQIETHRKLDIAMQ